MPGIRLNLRVLGYLDPNKKWAAHCLETDIVGFGDTFEEALRNLNELTEMKVSFAIGNNEPQLLDRPAPPWVFEVYNRAFLDVLRRFPRPAPETDQAVRSIPLPRPKMTDRFEPVCAKA